jgi:integrase
MAENEVALLLSQVKKYLGRYYYPAILCALRTGMRIGEIQALKWGDVDFIGRFLLVRRSWRKKRLTDTKNRSLRRVDQNGSLQIRTAKC